MGRQREQKITYINHDERERRAAIVMDDFGGILPQCEAFYLHSILYSAGRCLESFEEYERLKDVSAESDYLVSIVQEAVGHAAALSRYFWPSRGRDKKGSSLERLKAKRAEKLRDAFGLSENSTLYNRELRNAWEHFDERLDLYLLENDAGFFFPGTVIDDHSLADDPTGHLFKLLDPGAECLVLMGVKYFFSPIRDEVKGVLERATAFDRQGSRISSAS